MFITTGMNDCLQGVAEFNGKTLAVHGSIPEEVVAAQLMSYPRGARVTSGTT